jgi:hypothetical protein
MAQPDETRAITVKVANKTFIAKIADKNAQFQMDSNQ